MKDTAPRGRISRQQLRQNVFIDKRPGLTAARGAMWLGHCLLRRRATISIWAGGPRIRLEPHVKAYGSTSIYMKRLEYEPQLEVLADLTRAGDVVFDIGANFGVYALPLASRVMPGGSLHAFEPGAESLSQLRHNTATLNPQLPISVWPIALSDESKAMALHHVGGAPTTFSLAGTGHEASESITALTLDEWVATQGLDRLDVIKIDVFNCSLISAMRCMRSAKGSSSASSTSKTEISLQCTLKEQARHGWSIANTCSDDPAGTSSTARPAAADDADRVLAMTRTVAVAFTPAPAAQNPNLRAISDLGAVASYYRAIVVTFASARRWNRDLRLALATDCEPPAPFAGQLTDLDVELLEARFEHRPPDGFWPTFNASLYTIDVMAMLACTAEPTDQILLLDPDVLCMGDLTPVFQAFRGTDVLVYPTGFPDDEKSQGLSALDAAPLHRKLDPELQEPPKHYGGELYGFTPAGAFPILQRAEEAWQMALGYWANGQHSFVTEEHLLNYAVRRAPRVEATDFIRRIWTAPVYRNVKGDEATLLLWHLPAEKDRGFVDLAEAAADSLTWFWVADRGEYVRRAGGLVGVPRRAFGRFLYDVAGGAIRAAQRAVGRRG